MAGPMIERVELSVSHLKQFAYCPRIPYYQYVMPVERVATYKMVRGKTAQTKTEQLERRRLLERYGIDLGERLFGVQVTSERLGLSGRLDLLIRTHEELIPVDFKDTDGPPRRNHRVQLAAYGLLVEEAFGLPARRGFVCLIPSKTTAEVSIDDYARAQAEEAMAKIRRMIEEERIPGPTEVRARCVGCEFQNYCGDIW